jgi:hypothetical protein
MTACNDFWKDAELISSYSREQAVADGVLVDLLALTSPGVCKRPTYCTSSVWEIVDKAVKNPRWLNDLNGVIHDLNWMATCYDRQGTWGTWLFLVIIKGAGRKSKFTFRATRDIDGAITYMLPEED